MDFLRGLAILLVILRHTGLSTLTTNIGWTGVDLFFVLSGFLVSGILFSEFKVNGNVKTGLFFIRRGFKIYPLFFVVLLLHVIYYHYWRGLAIPSRVIIPEVFFFQNYRPGIIGISWSLAVEEHFYLLLIAGFYFLSRTNKINKLIIPWACIVIGIICFSLRLMRYLNYHDPYSLDYFFYTHFRMDALAFGVLIAWFYHFRREGLDRFVRRYCYLLIAVMIMALAPVFIWPPYDAIIVTAGLTTLYIGFGILLLLVITYAEKIRVVASKLYLLPLYKLIAWTGVYSYGIYLIHTKAGPMISNAFKENILPASPQMLIILLNFLSSICCGYLLSLLVEKPFLRLRDRYFPGRASALNEKPNTGR